MVLVSMSVAFGLAMSGKLVRGPGVASRLRTTHEALALSGLLAIVLHGLLLLPDTYLRPGLAGIAIPFVASHRPLWTALGVTAGWMSAVITAELLRAPLDRREGVAPAPPVDARASGSSALPTRWAPAPTPAPAWLLAMLSISTMPVLVAGAHRIHTRGLGPLTATPMT